MGDAGASDAAPLSARAGSTRVAARRRRGLLALLAVAIAAALIAGSPVALRALGRWLVVADDLAAADAIYVHAGHMPIRALEGADLYLEGLAPEIWLAETVPTAERAALEAVGVEVPAESEWNREVLRVRGVPASAIRVLPRQVANTRDEIEAVVEALRRENAARIILVTSRQHSRRVRTLWRRYETDGLEAIVRPSRHDPFDPDRWWTNTDDGQAVLHEVVGILDAWLDLGLRPERSAGE
jgi:uncharacterized SAM-binding protein YcdF (DUF218 family)